MNLTNVASKELVFTLCLGCAYVPTTIFLMDGYIQYVGGPDTTMNKIATTSTSSVLAFGAVLIVNSITAKLNTFWLGVAASLAAFLYFYIYKAEYSVLTHIYFVLTTNYSLAAFVAFLGAPLLMGTALNKYRLLGRPYRPPQL